MHMRPRRKSGTAHIGDYLSPAHMLSGSYRHLHSMTITGHNAVAVVDIHHIAVAAIIPAGYAHNTICRCQNRCSHIIGNINARMEVRTIPAQTIRRAYYTTRRPNGWRSASRQINADCPKFLLPLAEFFLQCRKGLASDRQALLNQGQCIADILHRRRADWPTLAIMRFRVNTLVAVTIAGIIFLHGLCPGQTPNIFFQLLELVHIFL